MYKSFLEVAGLLNKKFQETPVLYGSVGLGRVIGKNLSPRDIDILLKEDLLKNKWLELKSFLEEQGFILVDEKEHEFEKGGVRFAFALIGDLNIKMNMKDLRVCVDRGIKFKELNPHQYLILYEYLQGDDYRKKTGKAVEDRRKIRMIKKFLNEIP